MGANGGRAAAPAELRIVGGRAPGRDSGGRVVEPSPTFKRLPPKPPTHLSREASAEWRRVVPELSRLGILKAEDRAALSVYCETWTTYCEAKRHVRTFGLVVTNTSTRKDGSSSEWVTKNPAVGIMETAGAQLVKFAREFGLTPSAEGQLVAKNDDGPADDNPFG